MDYWNHGCLYGLLLECFFLSSLNFLFNLEGCSNYILFNIKFRILSVVGDVIFFIEKVDH